MRIVSRPQNHPRGADNLETFQHVVNYDCEQKIFNLRSDPRTNVSTAVVGAFNLCQNINLNRLVVLISF